MINLAVHSLEIKASISKMYNLQRHSANSSPNPSPLSFPSETQKKKILKIAITLEQSAQIPNKKL